MSDKDEKEDKITNWNWQKHLKELWDTRRNLVFVVGVVVVVAVVVAASALSGKLGHQPGGYEEEMVQGQEGQAQQKEEPTPTPHTVIAEGQEAPVASVKVWQSISMVPSGLMGMASGVESEDKLLSLGGNEYDAEGALVLFCKESVSRPAGSLAFPLGGRAESATFTLAQFAIEDVDDYTFKNTLEFFVDGDKVLTREISKENLLAIDEPVSIDLRNAGQLVVKCAASGKIYEKQYQYSTSRTERDYAGLYFPVLLADLDFTIKKDD